MTNKIQQIASKQDNDITRKAILYQTLFNYYINQGKTLWSRAQLMFAVQAAILAAGFRLHTSWLGYSLMFFGVVLITAIFLIMIRDIEARNYIGDVTGVLSKDLLSDKDIQNLESAKLKPSIKPDDLTARPTGWRKPFLGQNILQGAAIFL